MKCVVGWVLLAACGGGAGGADAPGTQLPTGSVSVKAFVPACVEPTAPAVGNTVYFIGPDGYVQTAVTDANGEVTANVAADTTVMIAFGDDAMFQNLHTYVAVQPGDAIVDRYLASCTLDPSGGPPQAFVAFPGVAGATHYALEGSCLGVIVFTTTSAAPAYDSTCPQAHDATLVVTSTDASPFYAIAEHVDLGAHGDAAHALALPALVPFDPYQVTMTNLPADLVKLSFEVTRLNGSDPWGLGTSNLVARLSGTTGTGAPLLAPVGDHTRLVATLAFGPDSSAAPLIAYTQSVATAPMGSLDASTIIRTATQRFNPPITASDTQTWTETAGAAPTSLHAQVSWRNGLLGTTMFLVAPYTGAALTVPQLPPGLAGFAFGADSQWDTFSIDARGYVGKTYRDVVNGTVGDGPLWESLFF